MCRVAGFASHQPEAPQIDITITIYLYLSSSSSSSGPILSRSLARSFVRLVSSRPIPFRPIYWINPKADSRTFNFRLVLAYFRYVAGLFTLEFVCCRCRSSS